MSLQIEATYVNGIFRPAQALPLTEGEKVTLTIQLVAGAVQRYCGSLHWTRDPEELHKYLDDPDESSWGAT